MLKILYYWLIRLHPISFRQRFGGEMLQIFDDVSGAGAVTLLFADAFVSLFRQWVLRPEFRHPAMATVVSGGSAANTEMFRSIETYGLRPAALINGGFITIAILSAMVEAMNHGGVRRAFAIGVHHPRPHLLPLDRASFGENELNTVVKFGPEQEDPWRAIASVYFRAVRVLWALDADQDLTISPWEIFTAPAALRKLDLDHDGKLSPEECGFSLGAKSDGVDPKLIRRARLEFMRVNPVLATLDTDHDGEISEAEMLNSAGALRKLDKNGDGSLTPNEVLPEQAASQAAMIVFRLDTNGDGKISTAECAEEVPPLRNLLESADRNHDGYTTAEELTHELRIREEQTRQFENALKGISRQARPDNYD